MTGRVSQNGSTRDTERNGRIAVNALPEQRLANFTGNSNGFDGCVMRVKAAHETDRDEFISKGNFRFEDFDSIIHAGRQWLFT